MESFPGHEGVLEVAELPSRGIPEDLDDVEAGDDVGLIEALEPLLRRSDESLPLGGINGLLGSPEGLTGARFDLHEHQ
jgi:hypothetical protein